MLLNKGELGGARLLKAETVASMTVNALPDPVLQGKGGNVGWGLANVDVVVGPGSRGYLNAIGEYGWDGSVGTFFAVDSLKRAGRHTNDAEPARESGGIASEVQGRHPTIHRGMNCVGASLLALITCLGDPDPNVRDKIAFERLSAAMRAGEVDRDTLTTMESRLIKLVADPDPQGFQRPFAILTLAEVARTDRIKPWMSPADRDQLVSVASTYLTNLRDYRAFNDKEGFRHGVAHGADLAMQLALNSAIGKTQLDRLLDAIAVQVTPTDPAVAYWAGEPDRLARPVIFIAQRKLHSDAEWKSFFDRTMALVSNSVPGTEFDIRKHHNARAFLLSVFATASDDRRHRHQTTARARP
jgi:hypothetical protein